MFADIVIAASNQFSSLAHTSNFCSIYKHLFLYLSDIYISVAFIDYQAYGPSYNSLILHNEFRHQIHADHQTHPGLDTRL